MVAWTLVDGLVESDLCVLMKVSFSMKVVGAGTGAGAGGAGGDPLGV